MHNITQNEASNGSVELNQITNSHNHRVTAEILCTISIYGRSCNHVNDIDRFTIGYLIRHNNIHSLNINNARSFSSWIHDYHRHTINYNNSIIYIGIIVAKSAAECYVALRVQ